MNADGRGPEFDLDLLVIVSDISWLQLYLPRVFDCVVIKLGL